MPKKRIVPWAWPLKTIAGICSMPCSRIASGSSLTSCTTRLIRSESAATSSSSCRVSSQYWHSSAPSTTIGERRWVNSSTVTSPVSCSAKNWRM